MEKVILISDINTELGLSLLKQYYANGYKIIGFAADNIDKLDLKEFNPAYLEIVSWNRISPIGVKNILIKGIARFREIHEALILQTACFTNCGLNEIPILDIEQNIDMWFKGNCFLLKEVLTYFLQQKKGTITLVNNIHYKAESFSSPFGEMLDSGFKALVKNLFHFYRNTGIILNCFESSTTQGAKFSEYIYKTINEKANRSTGKIFSYHDKKSFLAGIRNG